MSLTYYHGGKAGLKVGESLEPSESHVYDGCYLCVARRHGRSVTVGEWRGYLITQAAAGNRGAKQMLAILESRFAEAPADAVIDPPSARAAIYITTSEEYAAFYASRSKGDLYIVEPSGPLEPSPEDHFPAWTCEAARVVAVVRRGVVRSRTEKRALERVWKKADRLAAEAHP